MSGAKQPARPAYTLLEVLLVMAIMVLAAAIFYPSVETMYSDTRFTQAADMIRGAWAAARSHAITEGRPYQFAIVPNKGNYRIAPDDTGYWSKTGAVPAAADPTSPPLVLSDALPKGLRFSSSDLPQAGPNPGDPSSLPAQAVPPNLWSKKAVFLPDGTSRQDVEVVFGGRGSRELTLKLRALTGAVTVRWSKGPKK